MAEKINSTDSKEFRAQPTQSRVCQRHHFIILCRQGAYFTAGIRCPILATLTCSANALCAAESGSTHEFHYYSVGQMISRLLPTFLKSQYSFLIGNLMKQHLPLKIYFKCIFKNLNFVSSLPSSQAPELSGGSGDSIHLRKPLFSRGKIVRSYFLQGAKLI